MDKAGRKTSQKEPKIEAPDTTMMIIAIIAIFITIVLLWVWKKKRSSRTDILITGLCDSGKTCIFTQLLYSEQKETYSSIQENVGEYVGKNGSLRIIDLPGHERLRGKFFDEYKDHAKGIVYVIDSVTLQKDIRDVADYLYTILSDPTTSSIPFLILCNKQDETMAKSSSVIKTLLEKELNLVRTTRMSQLESVDKSSGNNVFLGKQGKDFEFSQLMQKVEIADGSAKNRELENLNLWIEQIL